MTQRRRTSKTKAKRRFGRRAFLTGAGVAACAAAGMVAGTPLGIMAGAATTILGIGAVRYTDM